ncbi:MAG: D-2-hydroxyacid dehydrogenase [Actinophytocola sp.]|uniref:D-2-hydroxyacid dehydrogenase n=1 Tax=Actinophytocola sp. TaxID=1872138 RepID=UPI0013208C9D|nr:D-2-hydroxyacid dehydrogenase [Actinophytocola sp.]MPZ84283.1 D-2-hydroxyacid dehydrogenase [Actinophytocola sp.]
MEVLVAQPVDPAGLRRVSALLPDAVITCREPLGPGESVPGLEDVTVLFADHCPVNVADLVALRWVQLGSAGYRQLAGLGLGPAVRVKNASGVNDIPIAEWCVPMMLSFARDYPGMLRAPAGASWVRDRVYQAELRGRRVGVFGYGSIGREVTRVCGAPGLEVWALSRSQSSGPARFFAPARLREFLSGPDFLVITAPLTDETAGRFGAEELARLPRHAVLLNPARAHVVDEAALLAALRNGTIAGAALDVHHREPMLPGDPFRTAPNTVVSPHVSGSTGSTHFLPRLWDLFADNVSRFVAGAPLRNEIARADIG